MEVYRISNGTCIDSYSYEIVQNQNSKLAGDRNMRWIDGNEINIKQFTGETLCEKLVDELWSNAYDQWLECADFIQAASFLIAFDTELTMEGIFTFLENSIGHYAPNIIQDRKSVV